MAEALAPSMLWAVGVLALFVTIFGIIELMIFYFGLVRIGLVTTVSGILLFLGGLLILLPGASRAGAAFLVSGFIGGN